MNLRQKLILTNILAFCLLFCIYLITHLFSDVSALWIFLIPVILLGITRATLIAMNIEDSQPQKSSAPKEHIWAKFDAAGETASISLENAAQSFLALANRATTRLHQPIYVEDQTVCYDTPRSAPSVDYMETVLQFLKDFAALYPALIEQGDEALPHLQTIAQQKNHPVAILARQAMEEIAATTERRFKPHMDSHLCPDCLTRFQTHTLDEITYYGCRRCGQSRTSLEQVTEVIAVLDTSMSDLYRWDDQHTLRCNALNQKDNFDFDRVEIIQADDEVIERFLMRAKNDPYSSDRYAQMVCSISENCPLSENTRRILDHTFGQIKRITQPSLDRNSLAVLHLSESSSQRNQQ